MNSIQFVDLVAYLEEIEQTGDGAAARTVKNLIQIAMPYRILLADNHPLKVAEVRVEELLLETRHTMRLSDSKEILLLKNKQAQAYEGALLQLRDVHHIDIHSRTVNDLTTCRVFDIPHLFGEDLLGELLRIIREIQRREAGDRYLFDLYDDMLHHLKECLSTPPFAVHSEASATFERWVHKVQDFYKHMVLVPPVSLWDENDEPVSGGRQECDQRRMLACEYVLSCIANAANIVYTHT